MVEYKEVDPTELEPEYSEHQRALAKGLTVSAGCASPISAQLALRDREIARLTKETWELGCERDEARSERDTALARVNELKEECKKLNRHNGELLLEADAGEKRESELNDLICKIKDSIDKACVISIDGTFVDVHTQPHLDDIDKVLEEHPYNPEDYDCEALRKKLSVLEAKFEKLMEWDSNMIQYVLEDL